MSHPTRGYLKAGTHLADNIPVGCEFRLDFGISIPKKGLHKKYISLSSLPSGKVPRILDAFPRWILVCDAETLTKKGR